MKWFANLIPILVGIAAALWAPLHFWFDMKEGLIAFLGFLAASLVQVIPVTANFLQSDKLTPTEAARLTRALTRQQQYFFGLLYATIAAMVCVIVASALYGRTSYIATMIHLDISPALSFAIASLVAFVFLKMIGLLRGLFSLHLLRVELVLAAADRAAIDKAAEIQRDAAVTRQIVPPDYGQIVRPH